MSVRSTLLACGVAVPIGYALADLLAGLRYEGYSFRDQTISELGAIGAPSRPLFSVLLLIVYTLLLLFGAGVWTACAADRRLKTVGGLIMAVGVLALTVGQMAAMQPRGIEQGSAGALHLVEGLIAMVMVFTSMGIAAPALGRRFRRYTIASIVLALLFGVWSAMDISRVGEGLATPWVGVKERIFWYAYQSWYAVLALVLLARRRVS